MPNEVKDSDADDILPTRSTSGLAVILAVLGLVMVTIGAFWLIGTHKTATAREPASASRIVVATQAAQPQAD